MSGPRAPAADRAGTSGHVPGEIGIWVFIAGDILLFSVLFLTFLVYRADDPALFSASRAQLSQGLGLLNTLLMLTSSWFVATAVSATRRRLAGVPAHCFRLGLLCGVGFVVVKYFEWSAKIKTDITMMTNDFFMFYFVYTGIHLIHVLIGMGVLTALMLYSKSRDLADVNIQHLETGASFWHLVDLLWIVLFALLYLVA